MEDQNKQEYHFLKEETKKIPTNKKKLCKKLGIVIVFAAIFGVVACLVFCMLDVIFFLAYPMIFYSMMLLFMEQSDQRESNLQIE